MSFPRYKIQGPGLICSIGDRADRTLARVLCMLAELVDRDDGPESAQLDVEGRTMDIDALERCCEIVVENAPTSAIASRFLGTCACVCIGYYRRTQRHLCVFVAASVRWPGV